MGWLYGSDWTSSSALRDHLRDELKTAGYEIVKDALVAYGRRYYAATRFVGRAEDRANLSATLDDRLGKTTIFVALLNGGRDGWGYKDMDESMGPCEVDCPLSVLDAADPVDELYEGNSLEWATEWRAKVRAYWAAKATSRAKAKGLKVGDKVWIRNAAGNPYTVSTHGNSKRILGYAANENWTLYRLPVNRIERVESGDATVS